MLIPTKSTEGNSRKTRSASTPQIQVHSGLCAGQAGSPYDNSYEMLNLELLMEPRQ
jgi:hypothetical protein